MALDGVLLSNVVSELRNRLLDSRIEKIYQPEKDEIHISLHGKNGSYKLLMSASASHPRIHITWVTKQNPVSPPMFCMLLRKHLTKGRIVDITQPDFERIVEIHVESMDEMGDLSVKRLIVEIMGRHSNIILVDNSNKILDSIKHVNDEISRVREVLPGRDYIVPPSQGKKNPLEFGVDYITDFLSDFPTNQKPERILSDYFTGLSRTTAAEIRYRALGDTETGIQDLNPAQMGQIAVSFKEFFDSVQEENYKPVVLQDEQGQPKDIFPFQYLQYSLEHQLPFDLVSEALEFYYSRRDRLERIKQRSSHLYKVLKTNLERCYKKFSLQQHELQEASEAEKYRLWGELITANIYQIPTGVEEVTLQNYYDPDGASITIPMNEYKTASKNAEQYFKKYTKAKNATEMVTQQLLENQMEIQYLESQLDNLEKCTEDSEIEEIRQELVQEGYIRGGDKRKSKNKKPVVSKPLHYTSTDGFDIFVGKNNVQNDMLTLKMAHANDIWLHTKTIPGSHVIIKTQGDRIPDSTLMEAAVLAAYFSKGRQSSNVPVDYCPKKNVKKPSGAKPGMVIYESYHTMYVTPSEEEVNRLKKID